MDVKINILFLDDCEYNIKAAKQSFKISDLNQPITYCHCPLKALLLIKEENFDVLITDYSMPILNGFELIEFLERINKESLPVIACSGEEEFNKRMKEFKNVIASFEKDYHELGRYLKKNLKLIKKLKLE